MLKNYKNIADNDLDLVVCRYLTFSKFMNMLAYSAIWFPKLNILQDQFEGKMPKLTKQKMVDDCQKFKKVIPQELHWQIDTMTDRNEQDSRELLVVNCWYLGESNSSKMWKEYTNSSEGVAIKSTIRKLAQHVYAWPDYSKIGKVQYVDFEKHEMTLHEANQGIERAFLKDNKFQHESEIRIATMNFKHSRTVNMEGYPYTTEQYSGKGMNNFDNAGLYIGVSIEDLIDSIVLTPAAPDWMEKTINKILKISNLSIPIE